jgi:thioredoxin 1
MHTPIIIAVVAILTLGGIYVASNNNSEEVAIENKQEVAPVEKEKMNDATGPHDTEMMKDGEMKKDEMQKDEMMKDDMKKDEMTNDVVATPRVIEDPAPAGAYLPYDASKLAVANTGDVVLFFHATWCPGCRALDSDITAQLSAIPTDLTILKLDYDTETELKKKYGVTTQQTLVQVDAQGNLIKKWSGSTKLSQVVATRN